MKKKSDEVKAWGAEQVECWLCGWEPEGKRLPGRFEMRTHHIARGNDREKARDELCALMRTCNVCHEAYLDGMLPAIQLAFKYVHDPDNYDRVKVNLLRGRQPEAITQDEVETAVATLKFMWRFVREVSA